jgi:glycosyltransferase involved in cell wall biosynthesis
MVQERGKKFGPVVSVLIPTHNRRSVLPVALSSVLHQDYDNLEIFVIRDGGEDVSDVVSSFNDPRIIFIDRKENRGKAFSLNEALERANGKYVAYLDDDDLYYPHHIGTLVDALEGGTDCGVAYSDLYKTCCKIEPDGSRRVLSKVVDISRDFDRFLMLYYNHTLHVSLMHRRDLLDRTGPYNENLKILIDWDLTRRLVFFSDFCHVHEITGEFYCPLNDYGRVSVKQRQDKNEYFKNVVMIRSTRPAKPWSRIKDMSVIFTTDRIDKEVGETLGRIWRRTFYPYEVYLPLSESQFSKLNIDVPNLVAIPTAWGTSEGQLVEAALAKCEGDYVAIVPKGFPVEEFCIEDSLYALINSSGGEAFELEGSTDELWGVVVNKADLKHAREHYPSLPIRESLEAGGISIRRLRPDEIPFQFDQLLIEATLAENSGNWEEASRIFEYMGDHYRNELWMKTRAAKAFFKMGRHEKAADLSREINRQRPTVDTLLLEAKINRQRKDFNSAIELLERAEQILEGKELAWT